MRIDRTDTGSFDDIVLEFLRQRSENLDAGNDHNVRNDRKAQLDLTVGNRFGILPAAASSLVFAFISSAIPSRSIKLAR